MSPLLSRKEVANLLKVSPRTLSRWALSGELRPIRLSGRSVRYDPDDVDRLIKNAGGHGVQRHEPPDIDSNYEHAVKNGPQAGPRRAAEDLGALPK